MKKCRKEFLGIRDIRLREEIANSALPLAELILQLLYKEGEWKLFLATMNKYVQEYNNNLGRSTSKKREITLFTEKEFLIGHALIIGAADCSERGDNLWASNKGTKWKKHWTSISQPTNFTRYMRHYRFKQFKKYLPKIWQDDSQFLDVNKPWARFSTAIDNYNTKIQQTIYSKAGETKVRFVVESPRPLVQHVTNYHSFTHTFKEIVRKFLFCD